MASRNYTWLTAPSGKEGTTTVYVDSDFGSDALGNGTRQRPYKTLNRGYNAKGTKPATIVCRGLFIEQMSNGNHSTAINGDYLGAATFDGQGQYLIYGFTHNKMVIKNVPNAAGDETVWSRSLSLAGVGRAYSELHVGFADYVGGVSGSSVCLHKTALYLGCIGGSSSVNKVVYDSPVHNSEYLLQLGGYTGARFLNNSTVYGVPNIADRAKSQYGNTLINTLFGQFAMIGNEKVKKTYELCVFAADVTWWWLTADKGNSGTPEQLVLTGTTSEEREQSLLAQLSSKGLSASLMPVFKDCVFSSQTSDEIFNDAANGDLTLKPGCDADWQNAKNSYCGALPPALHIPVMLDSAGYAATWDERSASGCLVVESVDNVPCIALDTDSPSENGEIHSKIVVINPAQVQLNSVWADIESKMGFYGARLWKEDILGDEYSAGDTLPVGHYIVKDGAGIVYGEESIGTGEGVFITESGTTFSQIQEGSPSTLIEVIDPSMMDAVYCRCRTAVYARVGVDDDLQLGATYLNDSNSDIVYHNRTIVPGESFVCMWNNEKFSCSSDPTVTIAVMFDDTRVPGSEWIPAATMADYYVGKNGGAIVDDDYGIPLSSGNVRSYAQSLNKSTIDRRYVQFCIKVKRYGTGQITE